MGMIFYQILFKKLPFQANTLRELQIARKKGLPEFPNPIHSDL
jgi:hypothetical protein